MSNLRPDGFGASFGRDAMNSNQFSKPF